MTTTSNASLVLSKGELYFDRFTPGTLKGEGELYLGNTPGFTLSRDVEEVKRFTSYGGQQIQIGSLITREAHTADITTDNVSMENLALWFGGESDDTGQDARSDVTEALVVRRGRWFQLGLSFDQMGVRHIEPDITFKLGNAIIDRATNFILDRVEGRFFVLDDAPDVPNGTTLTVNFECRQSSSVTLQNKPVEVVGSLRFISKNPVGTQKTYFFPYVRIAPAGDIDFKADDWQSFSFDLEVRRLNPLTQFVYIRENAGPQMTEEELAIINVGGMSLDDFPHWEDQLDTIINTSLPAADYGQAITLV